MWELSEAGNSPREQGWQWEDMLVLPETLNMS